MSKAYSKLREIFSKRPAKFGAIVFGEKLYPYQEKFMKDMSKRVVFVSARQIGKSTVTALKALWKAFCFDRQVILILAPTLRQARIIFDKIRELILLNKFLLAYTVKLTMSNIIFKNGSKIHCLPSGRTGNFVRGFTADMVIVDESAYVPDEIFTALIPSLAVKEGQLILIGTPGGRTGYFYEAWRSEKWSKYNITVYECPRIDKSFVEEFRLTHTEVDFQREMLGKFTDVEDSFFDMKIIYEHSILSKKTQPIEGYTYYAGLDIARLGSDESAYVLIATRDEENYEMHAYYIRSKKHLTEIVRWAKDITERFKPRMLMIDATGLGAGVYDMLKEELDNVYGITFSPKKRYEMYYNLKIMLEKGYLKLVNTPKLKRQFENFHAKYSKSGDVRVEKGRGHDDLVDALALACYAVKKTGGRYSYLDGIKIDEVFGI